MAKFTLADLTISLTAGGFFGWLGFQGHGVMMFVSIAIIGISAWRSIRRERDRREAHKLDMDEKRMKNEAFKNRWSFDPDEDTAN